MKDIFKNVMVSILLLIMLSSGYGANVLIMEGFNKTKPVKAQYTQKYICYTGKPVSSYWEYPLNGNESVFWESPLVPIERQERKIIFSIACGLGTSKGESGRHTLFINNEKIAEFNTPFQAQVIWSGTGGNIEFFPLFIDKHNDLFGIMHITPKKNLIKYGQNQQFKVVGGKHHSRAFFMLANAGKTTNIDTASISKRRNIIQHIQRITVRKLKLQRVCKWYKGKSAAVSLGTAKINAAEAVNFSCPSSRLLHDINQAVDEAVYNKSWLNEIFPKSLTNESDATVFNRHLDYLRRFDCVLWRDTADKIEKYITVRNTAEIKVKFFAPGHLRMELIVPSELKNVKIPLTVQVALPAGAWQAEARAAGKRLSAEYIVEKSRRGIRIDAIPGVPVDIYFREAKK